MAVSAKTFRSVGLREQSLFEVPSLHLMWIVKPNELAILERGWLYRPANSPDNFLPFVISRYCCTWLACRTEERKKARCEPNWGFESPGIGGSLGRPVAFFGTSVADAFSGRQLVSHLR